MNRLPDPLRRCHIIGGPGSGKTTLARRLTAISGIPAIDLDPIGYTAGGRKRPLREKQADVACIAGQPTWISEGIFLGWTTELLDRADVIVWLDPPWRVAAWRIVRRHVRASLHRSNRHPGLRLLFSFLSFARCYYRAPAVPRSALDDDANVTRAETAAVLGGYGDKVIRCLHAADVTALVGVRSGGNPAWPVGSESV